MDILESLLDSSSHAIFTLDREGIVTHINRQAKEHFGLFNHSQQSHGAGRLEPGDLVILATTAMGDDDGGLQQEDLAALGSGIKKSSRATWWRLWAYLAAKVRYAPSISSCAAVMPAP